MDNANQGGIPSAKAQPRKPAMTPSIDFLNEEPLSEEEFERQLMGEAPNTFEQEKPVQTITDVGEVKPTELVATPVKLEIENLSQIMALSHNLDNATVGMNVSPEYFEFTTPGSKMRGIYMGKTVIHKKNKVNPAIKDAIECVMWVSKGDTYMNGGKALVSKFDQLTAGTPVEIEYTGKDGEVKLFTVRILNIG